MELSKTYQYRKVMKPMLERKRRARINKCLDELKDLMVATLESEGEHITRLEKADILELTVAHLQKLKKQKQLSGDLFPTLSPAEGFRSGYIYAVNEVSRSLTELPGGNIKIGTQLMTHLGQRLNQIQPTVKLQIPITSQLSVQISNANCREHYIAPLSPASSYTGSPNFSACENKHISTSLLACVPASPFSKNNDENVWRPW